MTESTFVGAIAHKLRAYAEALRTAGIEPTRSALLSLDSVPKAQLERLTAKESIAISRARNELDAECKKEERRIAKAKTTRPCYDRPLQRAPICGYVFEKDSNRNKSTSVAATLCRSCGCTFDFSLRLAWAQGYGCSVVVVVFFCSR